MPVQQVFPVAHYPPEGELFEPMLSAAGVTIERILSAPGSASEPYDQATDEWVLLLQGEARLEVAGEMLTLRAGQAVHLPAHTPHRVLDTSVEPPCLWLAVHLGKHP
jgi:cupin 2 domain-containing protein